MSQKIKVKAVPGRLLPHPSVRGRFVGYAVARSGETADVQIAGGRCYVAMPHEELPASGYLRRAITRGDVALVACDDGVEPKRKKAEKD